MKRGVFTLWWISGSLSLLALLFPALIVMGLFLLVLPGLMLAFAPDIFIITTVLLLANLLFGRCRGTPRLLAYGLFLGAFVALDIAVPWSLNRSLDQYSERLPHDVWAGDNRAHRIVLLFARRRSDPGAPITPGCHALCQRLLSEHAVGAVLIGAPPGADRQPALDLQTPVTAYHLEHRTPCASPKPATAVAKSVEQISDDVCLIAEPATMAAGDLVIVRDTVACGPYPQSAPWRFYADLLPAERLGVYQVGTGEAQLLMLRIRLRAEPFFTPLIIGLGNNYGMESVRLALLRWPRPMVEGDNPTDALIDEFFRRHFRLDINFLH